MPAKNIELQEDKKYRYSNLPANVAERTLFWCVSLGRAHENKDLSEYRKLEFANLLDAKRATGFGTIELVFGDAIQRYNRILYNPKFAEEVKQRLASPEYESMVSTWAKNHGCSLIAASDMLEVMEITKIAQRYYPEIIEEECKSLSDNWFLEFYDWYVSQIEPELKAHKGMKNSDKIAKAKTVLQEHGIQISYWEKYNKVDLLDQLPSGVVLNKQYKQALTESIDYRTKAVPLPVKIDERLIRLFVECFIVEEDGIFARLFKQHYEAGKGCNFMYWQPINTRSNSDVYNRLRGIFTSLFGEDKPYEPIFLDYLYSEAIEHKQSAKHNSVAKPQISHDKGGKNESAGSPHVQPVTSLLALLGYFNPRGPGRVSETNKHRELVVDPNATPAAAKALRDFLLEGALSGTLPGAGGHEATARLAMLLTALQQIGDSQNTAEQNKHKRDETIDRNSSPVPRINGEDPVNALHENTSVEQFLI